MTETTGERDPSTYTREEVLANLCPCCREPSAHTNDTSTAGST